MARISLWIAAAFAAPLVTFATLAPAIAASTDALPPAIASAGVTQQDWEIVRREAHAQAQRAGVAEAALLAAAESAGANLARSGQFDASDLGEAIFDLLASQADQIADLQHRLDTLARDDDPAIARGYAEARAMLNEGRLADADRLLAQSAERDVSALQQADLEADKRRLRAGETMSARGQLADAQADFLTAAEHYARAAATVPQSAVPARWLYVMYQADSLRQRSERFADDAPLTEALRLLREVAPPLAPRAERPMDWARTQSDLGVALSVAGARGDVQALQDAVSAFRVALQVMTLANAPSDWAGVQSNLANTLSLLGLNGDPGVLSEAIAADRAALAVTSRDANPLDWANYQNNLGLALERLAERGDDRALNEAVEAFRAALEVTTRDSNPYIWAGYQLNLGLALRLRGERGDFASFADAITAFRNAATVRTRESAPADWAVTQLDLSGAFVALALRGDEAAAREAAAASRNALEVLSESANAPIWAAAQNNLGLALTMLAQHGDPAALDPASAALRAALRVRTRERFPADWAATQLNLAIVLIGEAEASQSESLLAEATTAARSALEGFRQVDHADGVQRAQAMLDMLASAYK